MTNMECPSCNKDIEVTWRRYWQSTSGFYRCPHCTQLSKIRTNPWFVQPLSQLLQLLPIITFVFIADASVWSISIFGFYFVIFRLDKRLDEKFGFLIKASEPKYKKLFLLFPLIFFIYKYFQYQDDQLNPSAQMWIEQYSKLPNLDGNAFIQLVGLQNTEKHDIEKHGKQLYLNSLTEIRRGTVEQKLQYPAINEFEPLEENPLLCDLKDSDCVDYLQSHQPQAKNLVNSFYLVIEQYLKLEKFTNFSFLNSINTEPNFNQLLTLNKLLALSIAIDIYEKKLDVAALKLTKKIIIDRAFMRSSNNFLFFALPVINFENHYPYLITELIKADYRNLWRIEKVLTPLTIDEISMNDSWKTMFVDSVLPMKFENIAADAIAKNSFFDKLNAKIKYKENMTINDSFEFYQTQIIPDKFKKDSLPLIIKNIDQLAEVHYKAYEKDSDNLLFYSIKNYRNPIGAILAMTVIPKFINLYGSIIEMDIRMLLANILVKNHNSSIEDILTSKEFIEPYSNTKPSYYDNRICYFVNQKEICISTK